MGRRSYYDTDEERLPEGMQRIGYDADTETYTYRDTDGSIWESAPGNRYGRLTKISNGRGSNNNHNNTHHGDDDGDDQEDPFLPPPYSANPPPGRSPPQQEQSWRHELMPLLNFGIIIGLFLLGLFWFLGSASTSSPAPAPVNCGDAAVPHVVVKGETCWAVAKQAGVGLDALLAANEGIDCDALRVGQTICVPS